MEGTVLELRKALYLSSRAVSDVKSMELTELETLIKYSRALMRGDRASFSIEELANLWGKSVDEAKRVVRKLRREGFIRRTRSGRYKLTLAGYILVKLYDRVRRG